jgi:hypothetical protein
MLNKLDRFIVVKITLLIKNMNMNLKRGTGFR